VESKQKKTSYDVLIIGGGPAGMFGAIMMKRHFRRVAILEKNDRLGKKLLLSGSGQCNLTHSGNTREFESKYGSKGQFLKPALKGFDNVSLLSFFEDKGILFEERQDGKFFPTSGKALDILYVLEKELEKNCVAVLCNEKVVGVSKTENGFRVETRDLILDSRVLVLATGGMSYPSTGSSGDGYAFAEMLGHAIVPVKPALSPVACKDFRGRHLAGLSFGEAGIGLWRNGKKKGSYNGALLFTHDGLSGPVIINNSRNFESDDILEINYIYPIDRDSFEKGLMERASRKLPPRVKRYLRELGLAERFCLDRMKEAGIDETVTISELGKKERRRLATRLTEDHLIIKEVKGYSIAMVTCGGVDTKEINRKTMESKKTKGLFFAGEIIDIDGETGGYNLQAAFSTAWLIANAVNAAKGSDNK
jgi:predicted Rossmann fold flavoprotein